MAKPVIFVLAQDEADELTVELDSPLFHVWSPDEICSKFNVTKRRVIHLELGSHMLANRAEA